MVSDRIRNRTAFTLIEAAALVAMLALVCAFVVASRSEERRGAMLTGSLANLREFAAGTQSYGADYQDAMWGFTWRPGVQNAPIFPATADPLQAHADQAVWLVRRRSGWTGFQRITNWMPDAEFSYLALADLLGWSLPQRTAVSPGDRARLAWQDSHLDPCRSAVAPPSDCSTNQGRRWPYSSSYELGVAFFAPDANFRVGTQILNTIDQHGNAHKLWNPPSPQVTLGHRSLAEVAFPSQKAMLYESVQRFFGREQHVLFPQARVPVLLSDGAADVRRNSDAGRGFQPRSPTFAGFSMMSYVPNLAYEPPTPSGATSVTVTGALRFTRSGLRGRDFAGPEVPWVP